MHQADAHQAKRLCYRGPLPPAAASAITPQGTKVREASFRHNSQGL